MSDAMCRCEYVHSVQEAEEALKWELPIARAGGLSSKYHILELYETGFVSPQDPEEADDWFLVLEGVLQNSTRRVPLILLLKALRTMYLWHWTPRRDPEKADQVGQRLVESYLGFLADDLLYHYDADEVDTFCVCLDRLAPEERARSARRLTELMECRIKAARAEGRTDQDAVSILDRFRAHQAPVQNG